MLAFQPRGFVFEPVRMRQFFCKYSEAEGSHFSALWDFPLFRLCGTFSKTFYVPKGSSLQFIWYFATERMLKNLNGSLFSDFYSLRVYWKFSFFVFFSNFFLNFCNRMDVKNSQAQYAMSDLFFQRPMFEIVKISHFFRVLSIFWNFVTEWMLKNLNCPTPFTVFGIFF